MTKDVQLLDHLLQQQQRQKTTIKTKPLPIHQLGAVTLFDICSVFTFEPYNLNSYILCINYLFLLCYVQIQAPLESGIYVNT